MVIGYTSGVYDLFHIGHLNLLKNAKSMCDKLIVGVTTDELSLYKNKRPIISYEDRLEIVRSIVYVDAVVPQADMNKVEMCEKVKANVLFVGDDWYKTDKWCELEKKLENINVKVVYFPYTQSISTTKIREVLKLTKDARESLSK